MTAVAGMVKARSLSSLTELFTALCHVCLSASAPSQSKLDKLNSLLTDDGSHTTGLLENDEEEDENNEITRETDSDSWLKNSYYYRHFRSIRNNILSNNSESDGKPYNAVAFIDVLLKQYLSLAPLWTSIIDDDRLITKAAVKNWFRTVKHIILKGKLRLRVGQSIRMISSSLNGRIREVQLSFEPVAS